MQASTIRIPGILATLVVATLALASVRAEATTYTYSDTVDPSTANCGAPGNCFIILSPVFAPFSSIPGQALNAGDVYNIDVTFTSPFTVDGATGHSAIYVALLDTNYYTCLGIGSGTCKAQSSDLATVTESVLGESSGGPTLVTGNSYSTEGFYVAYASTPGPDSGFTVTGFDATLTLTNSDPFPLAVIAIENQTINTPEPGAIGLTLAGFAALFVLRRRRALRPDPG